MAMLLSEAVEAFTSNDVPVAHVRFHEKQAPPYVEAYLNETEHHYADNRNSRTFANYDLVLHVTDRDLDLEERIEDAFDEAEITWRKTSGYRADADLVTITYQIQVYER